MCIFNLIERRACLNNKSLLRRLLKQLGNRNNKMGISLSAIVIILVLFFAPDLLNFDSSNTVIDNQDAEVISSEFNGENFEVLPTLKKIPVDLVSVNDGDTMRIDLNGYEIPVRYLIIDTPEMNYDSGDPAPFAQEAKEMNETYLKEADQVYIELDVGPPTDNYNRILAYVYSDDVLMNEALLEEGLARVRYVNPPNNSYETLLREAEDRAQNESLNIWN